MGKSYEADASVVHRIMNRQGTVKRDDEGPAPKVPKRRGTLLVE